ncbi:MAG: ParA family protein [Rhizonema sp. NSF051]|nr:ParA family protein [Rhizonema sp. NSF051]
MLIDADLEAPGLTYWERLESQNPAVSFIDFLEVYHYSPLLIDKSLELFAKEIKKSPKYDGKSTYYFLPACLEEQQLLDTPVLPEHIARNVDGVWEFGDAIYRLGQAIGVDYVLIDLRAGLSEISSPVIFDPRIQRFFVTTITEQSISGTNLVLRQISHLAPSDADIDSGKYFDPSIILSLLTSELKSLPEFGNALFRFRSSYIQSEEDNVYPKRLEVKETDFAQELLHVNGWQDARTKLASSSVMKIARKWALNQLPAPQAQISEGLPPQKSDMGEVSKLRDICQRYEFAENGEGDRLLVTEPLRSLAANFKEELPRVVSIGAKGSGKTFIYVQLSRIKYWEEFVKLSLKQNVKLETKTYIFPLLEPERLGDNARDIINVARQEAISALNIGLTEFSHLEFQDRVKEYLNSEGVTELDWVNFWIKQFANALNLDIGIGNQTQLLSKINSELVTRKTRIIFLFDGLEDLFKEAATNPKEQIALRTLIDIPRRLTEIRQANLGLIILLRRDFLRYAIPQNLAQFESLYRPYDLLWDLDSFLKLVFWICSQAKIINASEQEIDNLNQEEIIERLKKLWGEKLGGVKDAYTHNWVFAAITDFKGRLQARDIVRFLYHAAKITVDSSKEVQFDKWSTSRLLPPAAIRRALEPCSKGKVTEVEEEYPDFKEWVRKVSEYPLNVKQVPFSIESLSMDSSTVRMLEDMGVIYEDKDRDEVARFYMPEIFRAGLEFSLAARARPRVLVLRRKAGA